MKKIKSLFCIGMLSILLVGNVFGSNTLVPNITGFFGNILEYISTFSIDDDNCPLRICQSCKPNTDCRPQDG